MAHGVKLNLEDTDKVPETPIVLTPEQEKACDLQLEDAKRRIMKRANRNGS